MTDLSLSNREFQQFRGMIHEIAGIAMSEAKRQLIAGRLNKRLRHFGLGSYGDYYQLLMKDKEELQIAVDLLTTNETYFFREPKHFEFLREKLGTELRSGSGPLRIWSAACSSGEEPYTLALLLADAVASRPGRSSPRTSARASSTRPGPGSTRWRTPKASPATCASASACGAPAATRGCSPWTRPSSAVCSSARSTSTTRCRTWACST